MADFLAHKHLDLVINLPMRHGGARRVSSFNTHGMTSLASILKRLTLMFLPNRIPDSPDGCRLFGSSDNGHQMCEAFNRGKKQKEGRHVNPP